MAIKRVSKLVIEVRREKHWFSFNDIKGKLIDLAVGQGFEKINSTNDAVTLASSDLQDKIFLSTSNVGIEKEAISSVQDSIDLLGKLYKIISESELESSLNTGTRIGTKLTYLYSYKNEDINKVKNTFRSKFMKNYTDVEDHLGVKINDYAFESFSSDFKDRKLNITMGPVTFEEAVARFFNNQETLYAKSFSAKTGYFIDLDLYLPKKKIDNIENLKDEISTNVEYLNELVKNFEETISGTK